MPRPPQADEAGGLYHALNRGNLRSDIFKKEADSVAFERILSDGLSRHQVQLFSYQLMTNHYHLVLRPLMDDEMSSAIEQAATRKVDHDQALEWQATGTATPAAIAQLD